MVFSGWVNTELSTIRGLIQTPTSRPSGLVAGRFAMVYTRVIGVEPLTKEYAVNHTRDP